MSFEWKESIFPTKSDKTSMFEEEENQNSTQNIEEKKKFDCISFLQNECIPLIKQNQIHKIFEIENIIKQYDTSELICVLNSQLTKFVFDEISNINSNRSKEFINSCLNICIWITSIRDSKYDFIIKRYQELITPNFIQSIKKILISKENLIQSLLIVSNTFYQNKEIYDEYNSDDLNIIKILTTFSNIEDERIKSVCSLILKRILRCNFESNQFLLPLFDDLISTSKKFFMSNSIFSHIKTFQMLSKLIRHYSSDLKLQINSNFNQFIIDTIVHFTSSDNIIIFGNVLHLILSIIEVNQKGNMDYITSLFTSFQNSLWQVIKIGLSSTATFIQSASSEIFSFFITYPSPLTLQMLANSDLIPFSFNLVGNSSFEGKEIMRKAVFYLFLRNDVNFVTLLENGGMQFLCDNLQSWPSEIIPIYNCLLCRYPQIVREILGQIIDDLDEIIFSNNEINEDLQISAQALKEDILREE